MYYSNIMSTTRNIPIKTGFVKDQFAQSCQRIQYFRDFLFTGRRAAVGQRLEIQVDPVSSSSASRHGPGFCRVSGILTELGPMPSFEEWITTTTVFGDSFHKEGEPPATRDMPIIPPPCPPCPDPDCIQCQCLRGEPRVSLGTFFARCLEYLGTLHGQTAKGLCYLNSDFWDYEESLPVHAGRLYEVELKVDDGKVFVWHLESVRDVTAEYTNFDDLPEVFRKWVEGHRSSGFPPDWYGGEQYYRKIMAEMFPSHYNKET